MLKIQDEKSHKQCVVPKKYTKSMYFSERKINLSKIGRFGYKFDTLETNWGEFELKMWIFVFSQIFIF